MPRALASFSLILTLASAPGSFAASGRLALRRGLPVVSRLSSVVQRLPHGLDKCASPRRVRMFSTTEEARATAVATAEAHPAENDPSFDRLAELFGKHEAEQSGSPKAAVTQMPEEEEKRYDTDGVAYTKADFVEYYGGTREWDMATVATPRRKKRGSPGVSIADTRGSLPTVEDYPIPEGKSREEGDLEAFRISPETRSLLNDRGVEKLFPVQKMTYDHVYDGRDLIARARTGTGKTLAFSLPVLESLRSTIQQRQSRRGRPPCVLVLAPTRELAKQVATDFESIGGKIKTTTVYGGAPFGPQASSLRYGTDVVVGTAGRIMDHMDSGSLDLSEISHVILDEADRMLDIGFAEDIEKILQNVREQAVSSEADPQVLLFSATVPKWIMGVAKKYMKPGHAYVDLIGDDSRKTAEGITHLALRVSPRERADTLGDVVQVYAGRHGRTMIFTKTKREANELVLGNTIKQECQALHGDIPQDQREKTLAAFRDGNFRCLIATDVAARGLDIPAVDVVIQTEPPSHHEDFIHRSGRTARAGKTGTNIIFFNPREESSIKQLEKKAGCEFKRIGAPQPKDIVESCAQDAAHSLSLVSDESREMFRENAKKMIDELGAEDALAAALAHISGHDDIKQRSLLTSAEGFTTWAIKLDRPVAGKAVIRRLLASGLDPNVVGAMRGLAMFEDMMGAAFDVPVEFNNAIENEWAGIRGEMEKLSALPDIKQEDLRAAGRGDRRNGGRRDRRDGGRRDRGGYGSRRESYGGGGGWGGDGGYGGGRGGRQQSYGEAVEGVVTGVMPFGVFVDYGAGKDGLVATRNVGDFWVDNPGDFVNRGDKVKVQVIGEDRGKINLSMKGLNPHLRPN